MTLAQIAGWSEDGSKKLENQLQGYWAQDVWNPHENPLLKVKQGGPIDFSECPSLIKVELKYACYQKITKKEWSAITLHCNASKVNRIVEWLKFAAIDAKSFLDKNLNEWLLSLRTYLIEQGKWSKTTVRSVDKSGQLREHKSQDSCVYIFTQAYKIIQDIYDHREEYEKDVWDMRKLGAAKFGVNRQYLLDFTKILQPWMFKAVRQFIKYKFATVSTSTCHHKLDSLNTFSRFIYQNHPVIKPSDLDRSTIVEYIGYLALDLTEGSRLRALADLREFLEMCAREGWAEVTEKPLLYNDDYQKYRRKRQPKYIPEDVIAQINLYLDELKPVHKRMFLILLECGMRIGELCNLAFDCLKQDKNGNYFLQYFQPKMNKEITIPVSQEAVNVIKEQQENTKAEWLDNCAFLFPSPQGSNRVMSDKPFCVSLNLLIYNKKICDVNGKHWHFHPHQCRHTVGTRMINNGVPQHVVQRYLGHESPTMTQVYAHIHDETLRRELEKYHETKVVNIVGQIVELERSSVGDEEDLEWFRKTVLAMALPHGWCGRPKVLGHCNLPPNSCLNCAHLRTNRNFLEVFKDELKRTNEILAKAKKYGWEVQVKMNEPIQANLEKMIAALETDA